MKRTAGLRSRIEELEDALKSETDINNPEWWGNVYDLLKKMNAVTFPDPTAEDIQKYGLTEEDIKKQGTSEENFIKSNGTRESFIEMQLSRRRRFNHAE